LISTENKLSIPHFKEVLKTFFFFHKDRKYNTSSWRDVATTVYVVPQTYVIE